MALAMQLRVYRIIRSNPKTTLQSAYLEVQHQLNIKLAPSTLRMTLLFQHFRASKIINRPLLTAKHKKAHLALALAHPVCTIDECKAVAWSNECKINCIGSDGRQHCWIQAAGFNSKLVRPTVKFGGGNIMVWGSMIHKGASAFYVQGEDDSGPFYCCS